MRIPFLDKLSNKKAGQQNALLGLVFSQDHVALASVEIGKEGPRLKHCVYENCKGTSQALKEIIDRFSLSGFPCSSVLAAGDYELLLIEAPSVEADELKMAIRWRVKDLLPYHIDDAVIDVFEIPGQHRSRLMYVVSAQQRDVDARVAVMKQAGLDVQFIDIYELAQRNISAMLPEDQQGVALVRMTEDQTLLTITRNQTLYLSRIVELGSNALSTSDASDVMPDHDISVEDVPELDDAITGHELDMNLDEVEDWSGEIHESENKQGLNDSQREAADEIILEIQRSLDYYVSHFNQPPVNIIYLAPVTGCDCKQELIEYINDMLGVKTMYLDFNQIVHSEQPVPENLQDACFDALGLALRPVFVEKVA